MSAHYFRPGQTKRRSVYPVSNDFSRAGKYRKNKNRDDTIVPSLFFIHNLIFPVLETGENDRVYTSALGMSRPQA